ncbi:soluble lytic murein transglycosylase [Hoeflea marina]|uniref:Soluble lytic murein transglycosylase n=1 Tax=Hoeflea marina TaxID=274592 RepID=A0A317PGM0_9HYPH|nr:lytic transglycosylase domain-containing protein [Hoeflea marina]PWV98802.1 soluble lytic murein transglycosylase [Hoeflea marina]
MHRTAIAIYSVLALGVAIATTPGWLPFGDDRSAPEPVASDVLAGPATSSETTGSLVRMSGAEADDGALKAGLDALGARDVDQARAIRDAMQADLLDRHILTWAIALSGLGSVPSADILAAGAALSGWPGLDALPGLAERALYRENPPAEQVLALLGTRTPETIEGAILLSRALLATGNRDRAAALVRDVWRTRSMPTRQAAIFTGEFSALLTKAEHLRRMEMLMYRDRIEEAGPIAALAEAETLYKAWSMVIRQPAKATAALKAAEAAWRDTPALLYIRIRQLRELEHDREAAKLLAQLPRDRSGLVDPDEWWVEQRIVSRGLLEKGEAGAAYAIAAAHTAVSPAEVSEAEFHAGWYALRGLKDGAVAARHFAAILKVADGQITRARAHYWLGRAAEAGGPGTPAEHYTEAARYPTTFYGQLASARLDAPLVNIAYPVPSEADRTRFAGREAVQAIRKLEAAGVTWRADMLYRALAAQITSPGELSILSAMAAARGDHQLSLQVGKIAWRRGLDVAALAFPLGAVPAEADIDGSGKALAYSIARQESAFNKAAVSPANARGLLQILPGTARAVAGRHGLPFSPERLTSDAAYNATIGAHFLGEQISDFGGSYILTFIAYNAGPRRVSQWIKRFGDPRGKPLDEVIDWMEMIPYTETRDYVQRVMENYQIYKARLGQPTDIAGDLRFGRKS